MPPFSSQGETSTESSSKTSQSLPIIGYITLGILLCTLLAFGAYYLLAPKGNTAAFDAFVEDAVTSISNGNYSGAIEAADMALKNAKNDGEYMQARSVGDVARFSTGEEDKRIAAIRGTKEAYARSKGDNFQQSRYVNTLLGYLNAGYEKYVFDEVFAGPEFSRFLVVGDRASSIRNLAEHSYELSPSTESIFRVGQWYSDRMRNVHGDWELTDAEKVQAAEEILKVLEQADSLLESELVATDALAFQFMIEPRYYFWEAYLYGVVAREKPEYLAKSKESLEKLEEVYASRRDEKGNPVEIIATRLPYAYANYAWALYEVQGEVAYDEARQNLDKLIALVDKNPGVHAGQYLSLVRKNAKLSPAKMKETYSARMMYQLALMHKPFGEFLIKHGTEE